MWRSALLLVALVVVGSGHLGSCDHDAAGGGREIGRQQLEAANGYFVTQVRDRLGSLMYNTVRTAATAQLVPALTQEMLAATVQLSLNPSQSTDELFAWIPRVLDSDRAAFERSVGFNITIHNGKEFVRAPQRPVYYPYACLVPLTSYSRLIQGFDLLSNNKSVAYLQNKPMHLVPHSALNRTAPNSFGIAFVAMEATGKGYALGLTAVEDLLTASLVVERADIKLAAFDVSVPPAQQLLFVENTTELVNVTTVERFMQVRGLEKWVMANFSVLGDQIMIGALYSAKAVSMYALDQWVVLTAVLVPLCVAIDAVALVVFFIWHDRSKKQKREIRKRESTQLLLAYVNHEIRNPLQTILGLGDMCIEQLKEDRGDERLIDDLSSIVSAAEFIEHIASDILDLQRIEQGKITLEVTDVNTRHHVSNLEKSAKQHAKPDVAFRVVCDFNSIPTIRTDRYRLEQVVMNFISNAFKHTTHGSVTLAFAYTLPDVLRVSVTDTGGGIPEAKKALLFTQYGQVSSRDASLLGGFGLGLYLTQMLSKLLGGSVGFTSQEGCGSCFYVDLPVDSDWRTAFDDSAVPLTKTTTL